MANHLLRDYVLDGTSAHEAQIYAMALFLRRVLRYTVAGHTAYDIQTPGGLLVATGDTTPSAATPSFPVGRRAGINFGAGAENHVEVDPADHTVSAGDVGRILVLRSAANPRHNSGLFEVLAVDAGNNRFIVDFRSPEDPPAEAVDSLDWYLYEGEASAPLEGNENTSGSGYRSDGDSTTPRIVLQSPHVSGWQVRLCNETNTDYLTQGTTPVWTCCPGFGGTPSGDFPSFGRHTHRAMWGDESSFNYRGTSLGGGSTSGGTYRVCAIGDDAGQAAAFFFRFTSGSTDDHMVVFGIPDSEPAPLPSDDAARLFVLGDGDSGNLGNYLNNVSFRMGGANVNDAMEGMSWSADLRQPVSAAVSCWCYATSTAVNSTPAFDAQAGDSPFSGTTELLTVELLQGLEDDQLVGTPVLEVVPRVMGSVPFVRQGRTNFADFSLSSDRAWLHLQNEVWVEWQGPLPVP